MITLYTVVWGDYWDKYGEDWTQNIETLDPQPDRVIIVSDRPIESKHEVIVTELPDKARMSHFRNVAVNNTDTEWIVCLDLDDKAYPNFLANLNPDVDVHAFSYHTTNGQGPHFPSEKIWDEMFTLHFYTYTICGTSAIKTQVIKNLGGYPNIEFEDAAFWCLFKKKDLKIDFDHTIRFLYENVGGSLSRSDRGWKTEQLDRFFLNVRDKEMNL